jgi:hypothetical protein
MINKLQSADLHRKWTPLQAVARFSNPIDWQQKRMGSLYPSSLYGSESLSFSERCIGYGIIRPILVLLHV